MHGAVCEHTEYRVRNIIPHVVAHNFVFLFALLFNFFSVFLLFFHVIVSVCPNKLAKLQLFIYRWKEKGSGSIRALRRLLLLLLWWLLLLLPLPLQEKKHTQSCLHRNTFSSFVWPWTSFTLFRSTNICVYMRLALTPFLGSRAFFKKKINIPYSPLYSFT